jgi:hypothetical protein
MPLIRLVDIIPNTDSGESAQNSEPSLAVNPLDPTQMIAGVFGDTTNPYFKTTNGGATWLDYGGLHHTDKSLAWAQDGSAALTAILFDTNPHAEINIYSGTTAGSGFTQANTGVTYNPGLDLDQPWIRTGPSGHVYVTYNNDSASEEKTASILVSTDGGLNYTSHTLDRVGGTPGWGDAATVRTAVNGNTVYALFTRFTSVVESNSDGTRLAADVVVVRSDDGGVDGFKAFGPGDGVHVAEPTSAEAPGTEFTSTPLTLGRERIGGDGAIAVDPNNPMHVVVAYGNSPASGELQLVVKESTDGGMSWTKKFETPAIAGVRSALPALSILQNGAIGLLYSRFDQTTDPANGQLSQHLLTTTNDFVGITDTILATENNNAAPYDLDPYIGDFFDMTAVGDTFSGIFCASNHDNGADTGAQFANVSFLRNFTGTPGTSNFQLTDTNGNPVGFSIDPFVFNYQLDLVPVIGSIGIAAKGDFNSNGKQDFVWPDSNASFSMFEYDAGAAQNVAKTDLGAVGSGWSILGSAHFSNASTSQMLTDYTPNGTMTLWWVSNGALTGVDIGQRWPNIGFITNAQFTDNGGANISDFLVTNLVDHHLYDWWIDGTNTLQGIDLGAYWSNVALVAPGQFTANGGTNLLVNNTLDHHLYDWWVDGNNTLQGIDLGPYWSNVAAVATGQFTANGGANLLVNNTLDHHLYDWWIDGNNTLQGIDLGAYWSNVQLVTVGRFDNNSSNTQMLVQNPLDHHLYEWWITPQGQLSGIDLGAYWGNVQLIGNSHFNNSSANDELLIHNTADGHFYEWWIANNQLQGVDLGLSVSTGVSGSSGMMSNSGSASPQSSSLLVQAMASFGSNGAVANSNSALLGPDPSQQSALAAPIDGHLAHA